MDISNGEGVGISLFVQGCNNHCFNCFNPETWDFNGGKEWTEEVENQFLELANKPYIKRISILGGEPLAEENLSDVLRLVNKIRILYPDKTIWLYTGYTWEEIIEFDAHGYSNINDIKRIRQIISQCDVVVDGRYIDSLRDVSLHWKGSSNQRVIDVQKSLKQGEIILYEND